MLPLATDERTYITSFSLRDNAYLHLQGESGHLSHGDQNRDPDTKAMRLRLIFIEILKTIRSDVWLSLDKPAAQRDILSRHAQIKFGNTLSSDHRGSQVASD